MLRKRCANDNHGRLLVTVRFCSHCGEVVNGKILTAHCSAESHASMRRAQNTYCVDCGEQLIARR
jgi:hypothetical protein